MSIFEEEACHGDEQAALERTKERFGDPRELSSQLQQTVPAWNRFRFLVEKLRLEPGESLLHFAAKNLLVTLLAYAFVVPPFVPRLSVVWVLNIGLLVRTLLVVGIAAAAFSFVFVVVADRMARSICGSNSERSTRKAGLYSLASLAVLPVLTFLVYWSLPIEGSTRLFHLLLSCIIAPAIPILFLLVGRQQVEQSRYECEWADLGIAE